MAVLAIVVIGLPVAFVRFVVRAYREERLSRSWPPATCTALWGRVSGYNDLYGVDVAYTWTLQGRTWEGHRYSFVSEETNEAEHWKQVAESFSPGRTIPCYVDPSNPSEAVIVRNLATANLVFSAVFFSMFELVFGWALVLFIVGWRRELARREQPPARAAAT